MPSLCSLSVNHLQNAIASSHVTLTTGCSGPCLNPGLRQSHRFQPDRPCENLEVFHPRLPDAEIHVTHGEQIFDQGCSRHSPPRQALRFGVVPMVTLGPSSFASAVESLVAAVGRGFNSEEEAEGVAGIDTEEVGEMRDGVGGRNVL